MRLESRLAVMAHSDAYGQFTDEAASARADKLGVDIEYADPYVLQLDIDSDDAYDRFVVMEEIARDTGLLPGCPPHLVRRSRSGNRHVTIQLRQPIEDPQERILLQALLGSDLKREMLSLVGHLRGMKHPTLFFRPKEV